MISRAATAFRLTIYILLLVCFQNAYPQTSGELSSSSRVDRQSFASRADAAESRLLTASASSTLSAQQMQAIERNNLGANLAKDGNFAAAADAFERAIDLDPTLINSRVNLSIVYDRLERYEDALMTAYGALSVDPDSRLALAQTCHVLVSLDRVADSLSCYDKLRRLGPLGDRELESLAIIQLRAGEWAHAARTFQQLAELRPDNSKVYLGLGVAQFRRKKYSDAVESFTRALEIDPKSDVARLNLAVTYLANNNRSEALKLYKILADSNTQYASELYTILYRRYLVKAPGTGGRPK